MSLRTRVALLVAALVAVAATAIALTALTLTRRELRREFDRELADRATLVVASPNFGVDLLRSSLSSESNQTGRELLGALIDERSSIQVIDGGGRILFGAGPLFGLVPPLPPDEPYATVSIAGSTARVLTLPTFGGNRLQVARDQAVLDRTLRRLTVVYLAAALATIPLAALATSLLVRRSLRPVAALTEVATRVAQTQDASHRVDTGRNDEIGALARSFDSMLRALELSREQQRRLVADASHELRTPLTALQTNVELLGRHRHLDENARQALVDDTVTELRDLTALVDEIVQVAADQRSNPQDFELVALLSIAQAATDKAARRFGRRVDCSGDDSTVFGNPNLLERAIGNLVVNACKYTPVGEPIEVSVRQGAVTVADRGRGISDSDAERAFDRFFRGDAAADVSGSGLGLAIVDEIVRAHRGTAAIGARPGGGAIATLTLPVSHRNLTPASAESQQAPPP